MGGNDIDGLIEEIRRQGGDDRAVREREELRTIMTALRTTLRSHDDETLLAHPHASFLEQVAREGAEELPDELRWVVSHLDECRACRESVRVAEATLLEPESRQVTKPKLWFRLRESVLHPAMAAAYLLAVVALGAWIWLARSGSPGVSVSVATPQLVFSDPLIRSGSDADALLELPRSALDAAELHLLLQTDRDGLDDPSRRYRLTLEASSGEVVWDVALDGAAFSPLGMASVLVPSRLLDAADTYRVVLREVPSTGPVLDRTIGFAE